MSMLCDIRVALRSLGRHPGFAAMAAAILALGIGANTAIFSVVDAVLLRPLSYAEPASLVALSHETPGAYSTSLPYPLLRELRRHARGVVDVAGYFQNTGISRVTLGGADEPEAVKAGFVDANLFRVLGVSPALGRTWSDAEAAQAERVVVLSHRLWQRRFGGSTSALEGAVEIDGARMLVLGVMPQGFQFPDRSVELWLPLTLNRSWRRDPAQQQRYWWSAVARIAPGRSAQDAEDELNVLASAVRSEPRVARIRARPLDSGVSSSSRLTLLMLFGAVGTLLLITCANLAVLSVARGEARRRELMLRAALGASRARLVGTLLAEALLLAAFAAPPGVLLAELLIRLFVGFGPENVPRLDQAGVDARSLLFLAGCACATVLLFGLLPALRTTGELRLTARESAGDRRSARLRIGLASLQLGLAVVLLSAAGLLIRSFLAARSVELGFDPQRTLVLRARLAPPEQPGPRRDDYYRAVLQRLAALPGVQAAGAINDLFELNDPRALSLRAIEGRDVSGAALPLKWTAVSGDYFRAVGASLLEGRGFSEADGPAAPRVVVVDQAFARRFFPGESALGKRFKGNDPRGKGDEWLEVVGVVSDMRREGLERRTSAHVFESARQSGDATPDLLIRSVGDPQALAATVRAAVRGVDATAILTPAATLESQLAQQLAPRGFQSALLALFASLALLQAALGIFAVGHYAAARRVRELGVRLALGATRADVVRLLLRQSGAPLLVGGLLGALLALAVARALAALLFGVSPLDPLAHLLSLTSLLAVALVACLVPALRAARLDPLLALRQE